MVMHEGDMIEGRYRLDEHIGQGGMGEVWRAQDTTLDRPVAIKILSDRTVDEEDKRSFFREARLAAAVRHRNVALVLDFGTESGAPFIVMELLEGENLGDVFYRQGALTFQDIVDIILGTLSGLAAAHDVGIVHRDLKPENVFLSYDRDSLIPKLLDFGISKSLDADRPSPVLTRADRVVGTPAYMSPEQARGLRNIDHRSDLYSVGVIMFEALTGEPPFFDDNPGDLMVQIITAPTPRLDERVPGVPRSLADFVAKAMARLPDDRYQSADAMRSDLEHLALYMVTEEDRRRLEGRRLPTSWREHQASETGERTRVHRPSRGSTEGLSVHRPASTTRTQTGSPAQGAARLGPFKASQLLMAAGLLLLLSGGSLLWWGSRETPEPYVIKVQQPVASASDDISALVTPTAPSSAEAPQPEAPTEPAQSPEPEEPANAASASRAAKQRARRRRKPSTADTLSTRFQRQKAGVVRCVQAAPPEVTAQSSMAIRFTIDRDGRVTRAQVLPKDLATTPTGKCMQKAAEAMRFGAQSSEITFRIPLKTRSAG